jgi:hypothetical protein
MPDVAGSVGSSSKVVVGAASSLLDLTLVPLGRTPAASAAIAQDPRQESRVPRRTARRGRLAGRPRPGSLALIELGEATGV